MRTPIILLSILLVWLTSPAAAFQLPTPQMQVLPGTKPLKADSNLSGKLLDGAHRFIDEKINQSASKRSSLWKRDFRSADAYSLSAEPNRKRFMQYIGLVDKSQPLVNYSTGLADTHPPVVMQKVSWNADPELVAETSIYRVYQVQWPVLHRVYGEGLLVQPKTPPVGHIIALPDADQTPEQLLGLSPGISPDSQFARRLAENGYQVIIPQLISRTFLFPGKAQQQTYRERIYRQAFHMGRHLIGYEVQKVVAAVDWLKQTAGTTAKIGVAGYHEGGLIAFYSAAVDKRIDAVLVSGYFTSRQKFWDEPLYRNVWGLLTEFGDAELASLIAPRALVIEHSPIPTIVEKTEDSPDKPTEVGGWPYDGYKGKLQTPDFKTVQAEFTRIDDFVKPSFQSRHLISHTKNEPINFGSEKALATFSQLLGHTFSAPLSKELPVDQRKSFQPQERQIRQVKELEDHVQWLLRDSDYERNRFFLHKVMPEFAQRTWSTKSYHPYYAPDKFIEQGKEYWKYFWEEIMGKFDDPLLPANPQSRKIYDREKWMGYEVQLDVFSNLHAAGVLLLPKDIKPGEKRPVVVCQHGRNGIPQNLIEGNTSYNDIAAKLADQGFIVYVPYGLYRGEDRYRWLGRKANTLKKTLFSFMISQYEQTLQWLATLPYVDKNRIAFYGKS